MSASLVERYLLAVWYGTRRGDWLRPLGWLYAQAMRLRAGLYASGTRRARSGGVPVIVVGNLTAGGTGKSPLVLWLVQRLADCGARPGIISRGYGGGHRGGAPSLVCAESTAAEVGDEPLMMARRSGVPVVVCRDRPRAADRIAAEGVNVIVSDDGLQHLALQRAAEIVVVDGERRFGNGRCLPAGPLREPLARLSQVDAVIVNGGGPEDELSMTVDADVAIRLHDGEKRPLREFASGVHALAAIGNPQRFFRTLREHNVDIVDEVALPDHAAIGARDLRYPDERPVLITEKDAVKCMAIQNENVWYVRVDAKPGAAAVVALERIVDRCLSMRES